MRLLPDQLYSLEIEDFVDMYVAFKEKENREFDKDMIKLAWQTAHIMNSTGRLKKQLKPTDLYKSILDTSAADGGTKTESPKKTKEQLRAELKDTFSL